MIAYCYQSGEIEIGSNVPKGAIAIKRGKKKELEDLIGGTATLAYDNKTYLVPGIRIAKTPDEKLEALSNYVSWITKRKA